VLMVEGTETTNAAVRINCDTRLLLKSF